MSSPLKKGQSAPGNRVMFDAHMDEVGFIVTYITEEGFLRFATVGGIDNRVIQGKPVVVGKSKVYGIISSKPVHLIDRDHRDDPIKAADLLIDIGCRSREEAEGLVGVGDRVYFDSPFVRFGNGFIKSKALDDRAGCAVLIKMIQSSLEYDTYFSFTTREEVGGMGAQTAAYTVKPDIAVAVETTTAADIGGVAPEKRVCFLGKGRWSPLWTKEPSMINGCTSWRWTPQKSMGSRRNPSWACLAAITRVPCIRRQAASARWEFPCPAATCIPRLAYCR